MNMISEILTELTPPSQGGRGPGAGARARAAAPAVLGPWLRAQSINVGRHAAALRPFRGDEFGKDASSPTDAHLQAVNSLMSGLRQGLFRMTGSVSKSVREARRNPLPEALEAVLLHKAKAHHWVRAIEKIWDFYFELFGQRQSRYAPWLLSCDRVALDCYQVAFMGVGIPKSIPTPPPFSYMRTGFSPATFRRGIPLKKLGKQLNPFPLIELPYHRLVNPWTLGAILHEVSHNLQSDLGLSRAIPKAIAKRLLDAGVAPSLASIFTRWNRETFADLAGLLLGGPPVVASVMDVVGRDPRTTLHYNPRGVHPTPYLRTFLNIELLRRMGFPEEAKRHHRAWSRLYPRPERGNLPASLLDSFPELSRLVVDTICYQPYRELGDKRLADVIRFAPKEQVMIEEAARRLAVGTDPGIIPARFLIGAVRVALDRRLARPELLARNFYNELSRR